MLNNYAVEAAHAAKILNNDDVGRRYPIQIIKGEYICSARVRGDEKDDNGKERSEFAEVKTTPLHACHPGIDNRAVPKHELRDIGNPFLFVIVSLVN